MPRSIIIFVICLFFLLLWPFERSFIPVFLINNEPAVIKKGHYNHALLLLIEFEHDELQTFIEETANEKITYFMTTELLERSPTLVNTLKQVRPVVGLLGHVNEVYEENNTLLQQQLHVFEKQLHIKPMFFMTQNFSFSDPILKQLLTNEINAIAPTTVYSPTMSPQKGQFIALHLQKDSEVDWQQLKAFVKKHSFTSIEETIFDAEISSKSAP